MRAIGSKRVLLLFGLFFLCATTSTYGQSDGNELVARGQYIFAVAGGCACHSAPKGTHNAGARAFPIPFGTVYSTNLTSDKETGLGGWTDQQIIDGITKGLRKDGSRILPVMPYGAYSGMAQDDLKALVAYLRTLKPVKKATPELKALPLTRSLGTAAWLKAFGTVHNSPATAPKSGVERGKYLTDHVAICGDCHTPRNSIGVPSKTLYLAGAGKDIGPLGQSIPNITPDKETGIGEWKRDEIAELLLKGTKPDFDNVQGLMEEVIQGAPHGYKDMRKEDALAIADYLKSIPPIKNIIK
ncbi:MAG TPA: cytochrome c [Candidatus Binatia bacterium]